MYKNLDNKISRLANLHIERTKEKFKFYPRVISQTDILFTEEQQTLLNKGIKCNLNQKNKWWSRKLGLEAENAINLLPMKEQVFMHHEAAKQIQRIQAQQTKNSAKIHKIHNAEFKILNQMKEKLHRHKAMIPKGDKCNSTVILYFKDYEQKCLNSFQKAEQTYPSTMSQPHSKEKLEIH